MATDIKSSVIELLGRWATQQHGQARVAGAYLFGSLIYRDGVQFGNHSDVDLVVFLPKATTASDHVDQMLALREAKIELEGSLVSLLGREPAHLTCSIVAVTQPEILADIHKDGADQFFQSNSFLNLLNGETAKGFPSAGKSKISNRLQSGLLRFAQKKRNQFLAVNSLGDGGFTDFADEHDPLPKDTMRHAAMARVLTDNSGPPGAEYDVQYGLDYVTHVLYEHRDQNDAYADAQNRLSIRRKARGVSTPFLPANQLLVIEILFGLAMQSIVLERKKKADEISLELEDTSEADFASRFAQAFPGVRGIAWFDQEDDISERLMRLLEAPIERSNIWWFRYGNLQIENIEHLGGRNYLMDGIELNVARMAGAQNPSYFRQFVYVEFNPMEPTGLYPNAAEGIARAESGKGTSKRYYDEEYAIVDGHYLITRAEYDDGAGRIEGKLQDTRGRCELRSRYLTRYNFVIAPNRSPINSPSFDEALEHHLDGMLAGTSTLENLVKAVSRLPRERR